MSIPTSIPKIAENAGASILRSAEKLFDGFTGDLKTKMRTGNPADQIIAEATDGDYDLVIMGSRGLGTFSRTFLGSISNNVLNHIDKDVLIVK